MKITFNGGVRTVTGSCALLETNEIKFLVDCGMYQGHDSYDVNSKPFPFDPTEIKFLLLTHAHLDHAGLIPKLVKDGFSGAIITTPATFDLMSVMLLDSAHIQEHDAEWLTIKEQRQGREHIIEPLYTTVDAENALTLARKVEYGRIEHLGSGVKMRFRDAGHILGSAILELWYQDGPQEKKIVFSGDVGKKDSPIINDPETLTDADYVVIESTYGNRLHKKFDDSVNELCDAIKITFHRGGNVLIPSFAVGRTQDILFILNKLVRQKRLNKLNVYVDSPLAEAASKVYLSHPELYDEDAMKFFRLKETGMMKLHFTTAVEDSQRLNKVKSGALIIAGSGMCDGGRIRHHLKHNLWRKEAGVIFVGFQAEGTLGREIVNGLKSSVNVLGEEIAIKAKIYTIGGFSAHADRDGLIEWLSAFDKPEVFVVHGEEEVSFEFEETIKEKLGLKTTVPAKGQTFEI